MSATTEVLFSGAHSTVGTAQGLAWHFSNTNQVDLRHAIEHTEDAMIIGNAVLVVKGEHRFAGPLHQALTEFRKLSTDLKNRATVNTEGKAYLGSEIAALIAAVESVDWMGAGAAQRERDQGAP